jgi:hypothetical protein
MGGYSDRATNRSVQATIYLNENVGYDFIFGCRFFEK